jgi:hypothetical protein
VTIRSVFRGRVVQTPSQNHGAIDVVELNSSLIDSSGTRVWFVFAHEAALSGELAVSPPVENVATDSACSPPAAVGGFMRRCAAVLQLAHLATIHGDGTQQLETINNDGLLLWRE